MSEQGLRDICCGPKEETAAAPAPKELRLLQEEEEWGRSPPWESSAPALASSSLSGSPCRME